MNKNLMISLVAVIVLGIAYGAYMLLSGGMSTGDIPASGLSPATTASAPATGTPPPTQATPPAPGAPGGNPNAGGQQIAAPGMGGAVPPSGGGTPGAPPAPGGAPSPGGGAAPPAGGGAAAPGGAPAGGAPSAPTMTPKQKDTALKAFEKIDSNDIMKSRQEEAKKAETQVDADKEIPYPDTGRTDPLFINNQAIPEELRPPRTGETDYDSILDFLIAAAGTEVLDAIQIEVWSVMQIGLEKYVNMSVNGMLATLPEGGGGNIDQNTSITVVSASQDEVIIALAYTTDYTSVSKTKSYIPKE